MSAGYVVARENFKEAESHVSAEKDPVMFNLLYGLQSLTTQLEQDFATVHAAFTALSTPAAGPAARKPAKKAAKTSVKKAAKKAPAAKARGKARRGR